MNQPAPTYPGQSVRSESSGKCDPDRKVNG